MRSLEIRQKWSAENKLLTVLKNFAQNVSKWHYFDQVYSRFTRDGKMAFFTSQTRPLRRETSQRRQPEVFLAVIGTLRSNDADDNENVKKTIGLISKTTTSHVHHTFLYISFPFLHDYDVKMPNFAFY